MKTGLEHIIEERVEHLEKHGWDHDSEYTKGELSQAAIFCLTLSAEDYPYNWDDWFLNKIKAKKERMTEIEFKIEMNRIAGAFCAAEIDRLNQISQ